MISHQLVRGRLLKLDAGGQCVPSYDHTRLRMATLCKAIPSEVEAHDNAAWVHVARFGEFKGHPAGPFAFTKDVFKQIVANFERNLTPTPFKYEHPEQNGGEPIPSAGKIYDLAIKEDGLWAFTLFTDRAAKHIRATEYEFCSVVVLLDSTDRVTGKEIGAELLEVGLTDNPFIDGLTPIRL